MSAVSGPIGRRIVLDAGPVRRPHLAQARSRTLEHVRDPEAVADLDQLAPRDEHLATLGERGEREQHRRRVVVHDERRLGTGEAPQERSEMILPRAARTGGQVVLEIREAASDLEHARQSRLRERRPAEIRVEEDARRVQHALESRTPPRRQLDERPLDQIPGIGTGADLLARALEGRTRGGEDERPRLEREPLVAQELVDGRQIAEAHEHECNGRLAATLSGMRRVAFRLGWVTAALVVAAAAVVLVRDAVYSKKPLPGVEVRAVDLDRPLAVTVENRRYVVRGSEALVLDAKATAAARARRRSELLPDARPPACRPEPSRRLEVDPVLVARPHIDALVERLGARLAPPRSARVERRGTDFAVVPARLGQLIDGRRLTTALAAATLDGRRVLAAPLLQVGPKRTTEDAEEAAETARALASRPVSLSFRGTTIGSLEPTQLARLVHFAPRADGFVVTFDRERLERAVKPALDPWRKRAANARFAVDGETVRLTPSRPGLDVNPNAALASVTAAAYSERRIARLALRETRADLTTREAVKLGIRQRISTFTTEMGPSSSNRIHNIHLMAEYIDGTLIRPGETFSFNGSVGPRTVERGFREGQMIIGSLLVPSIGGGVCQTATTLFNNAFELGLPILARQNHSFYISHYPMGRDAAVSWGGPDFAFRNDLKTGILITTSYTNDTLTFSFWGTDPKRRIVSSTGPQVNWRTPQTTYAYDPYAPSGSVRTVSGSNQSGFDVTVTRKTYERGKLLRNDSFTSAYVAVGPTQIYGPGRSIPGPYFVLPRI